MIILMYILAFLKNIINGTSVYFIGYLVESCDVLDVLSLRFLLGWTVLEILKLTKVLKIEVGIKDCLGKTERSKFLKPLIFAAIFEPVLYMFFETVGISMSTDVMTGVILSLTPIACVISESIVLKEKNSPLENFFLLIGIVGVVYIAVNTGSNEGENSIIGMLFVLAAVISGALHMVFSRKASRNFRSMEVTYFASFLGMIVFNTVNVIRHFACGDIADYFVPLMSTKNIIGFMFLAVISTIVAAGMNNFALTRIKVSTMSAFSGISSLVTIATGVILNNESLYMYHYIGISLIIIRMLGVCYLVYKEENNGRELKA